MIANIYVSGPMDNVSRESACEWRDDLKNYCKVRGWDANIIDPCRGMIMKDGKIVGIEGLETKRQCMQRDRADIRRSHILFCNLSIPNRPYFGTSREIEMAKDMGKILIGYYGDHEAVKHSPWMQDFFYMTKDYDDARTALEQVLFIYSLVPKIDPNPVILDLKKEFESIMREKGDIE